MAYSALAEVSAGWTGSVALTYGSASTTVTPRTRESVASLIARLVADGIAECSLYLSVSLTSAGRVVLTGYDSDGIGSSASLAVFGLVWTGATGSFCGFDLGAGTYTGASSYTATDPFTGRWLPTGGLRLEGTGYTTDEGRMVASGAYGSAGIALGDATTLRAWTSHADAWTAEADVEGVYDVWHEGRVFGRVRVDGWRRAPLGRLRTTGPLYQLTADVQAVAE